MAWWRRELPEVTSDSYSRWVRAKCPPWLFFLGLSEEDQEHLAAIGDEHLRSLAGLIGTAVADPQLAAALAQGDEAATEELMVSRIAAQAAQRMRGVPNGTAPARPAPQPVTMGGVTERRQEAAQARQQEVDGGRSLLGRKPDAPEQGPEQGPEQPEQEVRD